MSYIFTTLYAGALMDKNHPGPMTPFDELVTSPELQIMKLIVPYAPAPGRQMLAAGIKVMELKEAMHVFSGRRPCVGAQMLNEEGHPSPIDMLNSFRPYLGPREAAALDMVINLKEMMSVMEMMQSTSGQESGAPDFDPAALLSGMLSPEQQEMFHMYSDMFSQSADRVEKGDDTDGRMDEQSGDEELRSGKTGTDTDGSKPDFW